MDPAENTLSKLTRIIVAVALVAGLILFLRGTPAWAAGAPAYYVDPVRGLDPTGVTNINQTEPNGTIHDGLGRSGAWRTVRKAIWLAPDAEGVRVRLMEGDHGPCEIQRLDLNQYPTRVHWLTICPDPANSAPAVFYARHDSVLKPSTFYTWQCALYISAFSSKPLYLKFENCLFLDTLYGETTRRYNGLVYVLDAHYLWFDRCQFIGTRGHPPGDRRPHRNYTTQHLLQLNLEAGKPTSPRSSHVRIENCTFRDALFGPYFSLFAIGEGVEWINNDISRCGCNGFTSLGSTDPAYDWIRARPLSEWPLITHNFVHNQAAIYNSSPVATEDNYAGGAAHGTAIAWTSGAVRVVGNVVRCYGTTAAYRNYAINRNPSPDMTTGYVVGNMGLNLLNFGFDLFQLGSGTKILHNTIIGSYRSEGGRYRFGPGTNLRIITLNSEAYYPNYNRDRSGLEICNNILLGYNSMDFVREGTIFTGNLMWSMAGHSDTSFAALRPGNKICCTGDNDSNSVLFTTPGVFFAGDGPMWASAFNGVYLDESDYVWKVVGNDETCPTREFDLAQRCLVIDRGDPNRTVERDFHGNLRDARPDPGCAEFIPPVPLPEPTPGPTPVPEPNVAPLPQPVEPNVTPVPEPQPVPPKKPKRWKLYFNGSLEVWVDPNEQPGQQ